MYACSSSTCSWECLAFGVGFVVCLLLQRNHFHRYFHFLVLFSQLLGVLWSHNNSSRRYNTIHNLHSQWILSLLWWPCICSFHIWWHQSGYLWRYFWVKEDCFEQWFVCRMFCPQSSCYFFLDSLEYVFASSHLVHCFDSTVGFCYCFFDN